MDKVAGGTDYAGLSLESEVNELRAKVKQLEEANQTVEAASPAGERKILFAIYDGEKGPVVDCKIDLRLALRILSSACDDMREQIAVTRLMTALAERPIEVPRIVTPGGPFNGRGR